ncbi:unnamed protein product [Toxocara canis]|uniref:Glycosyltransferase n=1 Tax=Toxocara canis TaxID=6265 RepID=A0A183U3I1_TOXCA|nr:unnamed protein product [Toxocara canis]
MADFFPEIHFMNGICSHYPIVERFDDNVKASLLHVDYGDDRCPEFMRLGALIKYYCIYASLHSYSQNSGLTADVFPWWLQMDAGKDD